MSGSTLPSLASLPVANVGRGIRTSIARFSYLNEASAESRAYFQGLNQTTSPPPVVEGQESGESGESGWSGDLNQRVSELWTEIPDGQRKSAEERVRVKEEELAVLQKELGETRKQLARTTEEQTVAQKELSGAQEKLTQAERVLSATRNEGNKPPRSIKNAVSKAGRNVEVATKAAEELGAAVKDIEEEIVKLEQEERDAVAAVEVAKDALKTSRMSTSQTSTSADI